MTSGIYAIINLLDGKGTSYIGSSTRSVERRCKSHQYRLRHGKHRNIHLQSAWNKYGEDAFVFTPLETVNNIELIINREQYWYDQFRTVGPTYNHGAFVRNPMLGSTHTEEVRHRLSEINRGKPSPIKGQSRPPLSKEHKQKISAALKGRIFSDEHKRKIGEAHKGHHRGTGRKHSEATKKKMSTVQSKENHPFWGKKHTKQTKQKISQTLKGRVFSDEHRRKIGDANRRRVWTEESRKRASHSARNRKC